jgi:hypothetical protein
MVKASFQVFWLSSNARKSTGAEVVVAWVV